MNICRLGKRRRKATKYARSAFRLLTVGYAGAAAERTHDQKLNVLCVVESTLSVLKN